MNYHLDLHCFEFFLISLLENTYLLEDTPEGNTRYRPIRPFPRGKQTITINVVLQTVSVRQIYACNLQPVARSKRKDVRR